MANRNQQPPEYPFARYFGFRNTVLDKKHSYIQYMNQFLNRVQQMFRYDGLPDTLPSRYLEMYLLNIGHCCITQVEGGVTFDGKERKPGLYALQGNLSGIRDAYELNTQYVVANPYLMLYETLDIGETCVLCRNNSYLTPLSPIIGRYAELLVEADITLRNMCVQARAPVGIVARDDTALKSAEKFISRLEEGKISIIGDNLVFEGVNSIPLRSPGNETITDMVEFRQYYLGALFNELGVNANFNMKRESINNSETELNKDALFPLIDEMLEARETFVEEVNSLYNAGISVSLSSTWEQEAEEAEAALEAMENPEAFEEGGDEDGSGDTDRGPDDEKSDDSEKADT